MECNKCHKDVQPLELYTGELACPKCISQISLIPRQISAANPLARELVSLSELYYHYALCKSARIATPELISRCSLTTDEMIDKSVEYCRDALRLGEANGYVILLIDNQSILHASKLFPSFRRATFSLTAARKPGISVKSRPKISASFIKSAILPPFAKN